MQRPYHLAIMVLVVGVVVGAGCKKQTNGVYSQGAGQIPANNDKDGDGIPDDWEVNGVDYTYPPDGSKHHLDLKNDYGASPQHKDIFVWIAWMEDATHTHKPEPEAIAIVKQAFANAPVQNIDGYPGVNLHVVFAPEPIPEKQVIGSVDADGNYDWSEYDALEQKYFPKELQGIFYFCLFAHDIDADHNSGITKNIPGREFIVALGGFTNMVGTAQEKAGTFMHELGHALGLRHGGFDDINFKPNYLSVMNYLFQLNGLPINGVQGNYDYSRFKLDCSESKLNKHEGLTSDPSLTKYGTQYYCCAACKGNNSIPVNVPSITGTPTDWNCDGNLQTGIIATDINNDNTITALVGADDWQDIILKPAGSTAGVTPRSVVGLKATGEITPRQADSIRLFPVAGVAAVKTGTNIFVSWNQVPLDRVLAYRVYRSSTARVGPELVGTIDDTAHPSFTDADVKGGSYQYFVTAVFAPHSFAIQRGDENFPVPVKSAEIPAATAKNTGLFSAETTGHFSALKSMKPSIESPIREIDKSDQVAEIRKSSPGKSARFENLGQTAPQNRGSFGLFPKSLYETDLSSGATVVVK
jgi:hypothetical protein